ncbi:MAG: ABC transporter substrate-binding protein [Clostridia bacterium]|nr:ABC transporter substrate-binding protein [Clostridia bacterium]
MKKLSIFIVAIMLFISCGFFTGCKDKNTIRLNEVTHSIFYAPLYVAINKGYFEEEGLKIELTNGGGADSTMTAILSGDADIGLMGPEAAIYVVAGEAQNKPVVFGQLTKRDGSFIVSKTEDNNFDWSKLANTTIIGGRKGGVPAMTLEYCIKQSNLEIGTNAGQVNLRTDVAFNLTASVFDSTDAEYCTLFEPNATQLCNEKGYHIVDSVGRLSGEIPYTAFAAKESYLKNNKEQAKKFLKAVVRGYRFLTSATPEEIAQAIAPSFTGVSNEDLVAAINSYISIDAWMSTPVMQESAYNRLLDIMESAGELDERVAFNDVVDNTIAREVIAELNA